MKTAARYPQEPLFLGIDGGGSKTTAWLANGKGKILARATGGPANPLKAGMARAADNVVAVAREALREAGIKPARKLEAACAGIAGAGRPAAHREMLKRLRRGIPARRHLLTTDAAIALEAALGNAAGVVVIAGTGSAAFGRDAKGNILRCGGWGSRFSDEGSGYDVARRSVAAALAALDGREPRTRLSADLRRALKIRGIADVVALDLTPDALAALFPLTLRAARHGDRVARRLCAEAGADLAALASALLPRLGRLSAPPRVFCTGGVFRSSPEIYRAFARRVRQGSPGARIALLERAPVQGALNLARASVGIIRNGGKNGLDVDVQRNSGAAGRARKHVAR